MQRAKVKKRNVVLKMGTYKRLEKYKISLIGKKANPRLTFDEVINDLLGKVDKE